MLGEYLTDTSGYRGMKSAVVAAAEVAICIYRLVIISKEFLFIMIYIRNIINYYEVICVHSGVVYIAQVKIRLFGFKVEAIFYVHTL